MLSGMPTLGIRFDIEKAGGGYYGMTCWEVFWRVVDVKKLAGALLCEGDTNATLQDKENVYCLAIQSTNANILREIRAALESSPEFNKVASSPRFIENEQVWREPLPDRGRVDASGSLVGREYTPYAALNAVQEEQRQAQSAPMIQTQSAAENPNATSPARKPPTKKWWQFWR